MDQGNRNRDAEIIYEPIYLLSVEPPMCIGCDQHLTVKHILLTCSDFMEMRESHFTAQTLRMLFQDISPEKIFKFLKEINIFGKI